MSETVLLTGWSGMVGRDTVKRLAADGHRVVVTTHQSTAGPLPAGVQSRPVDLADAEEVRNVVAEVAPDAIVHLAAVIPPRAYRDPGLARRVNVDATAALLRAAEAQPNPPRFLHASSGSVYGSRNPHRVSDLLRVETPAAPCEVYGSQKLDAERLVCTSNLRWTVLRLGSVMSTDPRAMPMSADLLYFGAALPTDARLHTVDARDVATAFAAVLDHDAVEQILLIGGDDTHLLTQAKVVRDISAANGLTDVPLGRPGNPDADWYPVGDWMDVAEAQRLLKFQRYTWPELLEELRFNTGRMRHLTTLMSPLARAVLKRRSPYRKSPGCYADVWTALANRFGEARLPEPEQKS